MERQYNKKALITGVYGQDGSLLAELLLNKGYIVFGISRTDSNQENVTNILSHPNFKPVKASITDTNFLSYLLKEYQFDEVYNFASQSNVRYSYDNIYETFDSTLMGYVNLIECINKFSKNTKIFQSISSSIFGKTLLENNTVNENHKFSPISPYASAKLFTYNFGVNFREINNLKIINGILFNHESSKSKRQLGILSTIVQKAIEIQNGLQHSWHIPNLEIEIDMSDANEIVGVIFKLMQVEEYSDFIIASGQNYTIRELCEMVFTKLGLNYLDYITCDQHTRKKTAIADTSRLKNIGISINSDLDILITSLIENKKI